MKAIMFLVFALFGPASAAELEIGLMTHHWHTRGLNEDNRLIGVEWRGIEAATFVNSYEDRSYSLGYRFELSQGWSVSVGAIHGYRENSKWFPARINDIVVCPFLNYTINASEAISVRVRTNYRISFFGILIKI